MAGEPVSSLAEGLSSLDLPSGVGGHVVGTALAGVAAVLFAVGSVAVQAATAQSGSGGAPEWRVLLRRPAWLAGQGATAGAALLQVVALGLAPVAIVQPVLASGLVLALGVRAVLDRAVPPPGQIAGALCATVGLAVFLVAAQPAGSARPAALAVVLLSAAVVVVLAAATTRLPRGNLASLVAGLVAGASLGLAAVLVAAALDVLQRHGIVAALSAPATWAAVITAVAAEYTSQQAFARGSLAVSLPALTVVDPVVAVPMAAVLLGEHLAPGHAWVWGPAGALAAVGVVLLGRSTGAAGHPSADQRADDAEPDLAAGTAA